VLNLILWTMGSAADKSPAEDTYARVLVWPAHEPEAFVPLVRLYQHDGLQPQPSQAY
jgi:hypothetical protein